MSGPPSFVFSATGGFGDPQLPCGCSEYEGCLCFTAKYHDYSDHDVNVEATRTHLDDLQLESNHLANSIPQLPPDDSVIDPYILEQDVASSQYTTNTGDSYVPGLNLPRADLWSVNNGWDRPAPTTPSPGAFSAQSSLLTGSAPRYYLYETPPTISTPSIGRYPSYNYQFVNSTVSSRASANGDTSSILSSPTTRRPQYRSRSPSRRSHIRKHTRMPDFVQTKEQCPITGCEVRLADKAGVRRHLETHDPNKQAAYREECAICGHRSKNPKDARRHEARHRGRELRCTFPGCSSTFKNRPDNVRRHLENKHGIAKEFSDHYFEKIDT